MNSVIRVGLAAGLLAAAGASGPGNGEAVGGLKLTISAEAGGKCRLKWQNVSGEAIVLERLDCAGCFLQPLLRFRNGKGEVLPAGVPHVHFRAPERTFLTLEAGKTHEDVFEAREYMSDLPDGKYELWAQFDQKMLPGGPAGHWTGSIASQAVKLDHRKPR